MSGLFVNWPHFVKTSVLARCWIRCIDMLVRHHSVPCLVFLDVFIFAWGLWRFSKDMIHVVYWPRSVCSKSIKRRFELCVFLKCDVVTFKETKYMLLELCVEDRMDKLCRFSPNYHQAHDVLWLYKGRL